MVDYAKMMSDTDLTEEKVVVSVPVNRYLHLIACENACDAIRELLGTETYFGKETLCRLLTLVYGKEIFDLIKSKEDK